MTNPHGMLLLWILLIIIPLEPADVSCTIHYEKNTKGYELPYCIRFGNAARTIILYSRVHHFVVMTSPIAIPKTIRACLVLPRV